MPEQQEEEQQRAVCRHDTVIWDYYGPDNYYALRCGPCGQEIIRVSVALMEPRDFRTDETRALVQEFLDNRVREREEAGTGLESSIGCVEVRVIARCYSCGNRGVHSSLKNVKEMLCCDPSPDLLLPRVSPRRRIVLSDDDEDIH